MTTVDGGQGRPEKPSGLATGTSGRTPGFVYIRSSTPRVIIRSDALGASKALCS